MANLCDNTLHINCNKEDLSYIKDFLKNNSYGGYECYLEDPDGDNYYAEFNFGSKWVFPEEVMDELIKGLKYKEDFDAACLSVEWGCYYTQFHSSDGEGWYNESILKYDNTYNKNKLFRDYTNFSK